MSDGRALDQDREDAGDTDDVEDAAGDHGPALAAPGEVSLVAGVPPQTPAQPRHEASHP